MFRGPGRRPLEFQFAINFAFGERFGFAEFQRFNLTGVNKVNEVNEVTKNRQMRMSFQLEGAEALAAQLTQLGTQVERKVARPAVRAGQKVLLDASRRRARAIRGRSDRPLYAWRLSGEGKTTLRGPAGIRMSDLIAASLIIKAPRRQVPNSYSLQVQLASGVPAFVHVSQKGRRTYIPAAIEYGHGSTPELAARPFMRPASLATVPERMRVLGQELGAGILRAAIVGRSK